MYGIIYKEVHFIVLIIIYYINPAIDKNWKEKVDKYIDYICKKRETYKDWFLADKK